MYQRLAFVALVLVAAPGIAAAQDATVGELIVIAPTPLSASEVPLNQIAAGVAIVDSRDLERTGAPSLLRALNASVGQVSVNGAQANPFQPNVLYRGFEASPLVGNGQGLAVYVDGARFNQPFGDTMNWDLIPDGTIKSVTVSGSNPIFGLNALGGSLDVRLKTGADLVGLGADLSAGSFGRRDGFVEYGAAGSGMSFYIGARALDDDGWRDFTSSELRQVYADVGFEVGRFSGHLKILGADNDLIGNGPAPIELLAVDREAVFTWPDRTQNTFGRLSLTGAFAFSEALSFQGDAYVQRLRQRTLNGDAAEIEECDDEDFEDFVCTEEEDDEPLVNAAGDPIPDFLDGGTYGFLNQGATISRAAGASLQATHVGELSGRPNRFLAGLAYDSGRSDFGAFTEIGELAADRGVIASGILVEQPDGSIASVRVKADNRYLGIYASEVLEVTPELTLTLSGRYNHADVELRDQIGTALNGRHKFSRFNPSVGLTWDASDNLSVYAGYSEANRAPTPAELSCADPAAPCSLTNFFLSDPPLDQVVSHTFEVGARGRFADNARWSLGAFTTDNEDDIMFVASPIAGRAFFQNVGETRRQGLTADVHFNLGGASIDLGYALTDATFRSPLTLNSENNPNADANGQISVSPGDRIPGIARHKVKLSVDYELSKAWSIGLGANYSDGQYFQGDESNLNPKTPAYTTVDLASRYQLTDAVQVYVSVENLFDAEYETFGTYSSYEFVPVSEVPGISDPRSLSPGAPRSVFAGLRLKF